MSNARAKTYELLSRLANRGINVDFDVAHTLRRAELTLRRWAELECGDSNDYASWAIERDEQTGKPYRVTYPHNSDKVRRHATPDRENGALRRVAATGLHFYHQTDPRGAALYVSNEPLTDSNYTNGVCCAI